jgi:hypothetical protein
VTVIDVTGTTLTASNIQAELQKVYSAIPAEMILKATDGSGEAGIYVSMAAYNFYRQLVYASSPIAFVNSANVPVLNFLGIDLWPTPGLPANAMVFAAKTNLWVGTDLREDMEDIKLIDMRQTTGDDKVRIRGAFTIGVNFGVGAEIVYYRP